MYMYMYSNGRLILKFVSVTVLVTLCLELFNELAVICIERGRDREEGGDDSTHFSLSFLTYCNGSAG